MPASEESATNPLQRILPAVSSDERRFWTGGERGELLIYQCQACHYRVHPPAPFCPQCDGTDVIPSPVSGFAVVESFTVNQKQWVPDLPVPYVLALVSLVEQPDIYLPTNIVGCATEQVSIGMKVQVIFEQHEDLWIPLFKPVCEE